MVDLIDYSSETALQLSLMAKIRHIKQPQQPSECIIDLPLYCQQQETKKPRLTEPCFCEMGGFSMFAYVSRGDSRWLGGGNVQVGH